ncbi:MAG: hypothetical protein ABUL62_18135 [Myxococcales bacterium]
MKYRVVGLVAVYAVMLSAGSALAAFNASLPGYTEVASCPSGTGFPEIHFANNWNGTDTKFFDSSTIGGDVHWNYADKPVPPATTTDSFGCGQWVHGSVAGGAGYVAGRPSVATGWTVNVSTNWYEFGWPSFSDFSNCGHQHLSTYVYGWRYNGSTWTFEFVSSTMMSTFKNTSTGRCEFKGTGNPEYASTPGYTWGNGAVSIRNSPYAVLYTKHNANDHAGFDCGNNSAGQRIFGCMHPVLASVWYNR